MLDKLLTLQMQIGTTDFVENMKNDQMQLKINYRIIFYST